LKLKTSKITKTVDEVKDADEFTLSLRIVEIDNEEEAESLRIHLKKALIKYGGQEIIDEATSN